MNDSFLSLKNILHKGFFCRDWHHYLTSIMKWVRLQTLLFFSRGSFKMLGHAVRAVTVSRGNKEGDNAFLLPELDFHVSAWQTIPYAVKHNVSMDFLMKLLSYHKSVSIDPKL